MAEKQNQDAVLAGIKPILSEICILPPFGRRSKKLSGKLTAHKNSFTYSLSTSDKRVDILFDNIKHAFFQPADDEMITLIHFHLREHIRVGKKETKDVQFYFEVMNLVHTRKSKAKLDAIEKRETILKEKINNDFTDFVNRVNNLHFDRPSRQFGFRGIQHEVSVFIVPTTSCLINLIETPFFVVSLSEIEIVNLERVGNSQMNFDMAIVFKDLKRDVIRIDSIPSISLNNIKEWLQTKNIKYYESKLNMNWVAILKTIRDDTQRFIKEGRWKFLNLKARDSDSDDDSGSEPGSNSDSEDDDDSRSESHGGHSGSAPKRQKLV